MKKDILYITVIIALAIALFTFIFRVGQVRNESDQSIKALTDSLHTYVAKDGLYTAEISTLVTDFKTLKNQVRAVDKQMADLKRVVDKNTQSAVALELAVKESGGNSTTIIHTDTVSQNGVQYLFPTYSTSWSRKFSIGHITASKDSIDWDIEPIVPLTIEHTFKRDKWYDPKYPIVQVKSENPNVNITGLRSYTVPKQRKYIVPKLAAAAVLGFTLGKL